MLDPHKADIKRYLQLGLNLAAIRKIINPQLESPITYNSFKYFVQHEADLLSVWQTQRGTQGRGQLPPPR